jgi:putative flippase GtrA
VKRQALRFLLVGGLNTVGTYAIFVLLGLVMDPGVAYTIAFLIGLAWVVFGSSRLVFRSEHGSRRLLMFLAWYLVIYAIGRGIIAVMDPVGFWPLAFASAVVLVCTTPLTFIGGRVIFKPRS